MFKSVNFVIQGKVLTLKEQMMTWEVAEGTVMHLYFLVLMLISLLPWCAVYCPPRGAPVCSGEIHAPHTRAL